MRYDLHYDVRWRSVVKLLTPVKMSTIAVRYYQVA